MDIYKLEINEHNYFKQLLNLIKHGKPMGRQYLKELLTILEKEMIAHGKAEEEAFFIPLRKKLPNLTKDVENIKFEHKNLVHIFEDLYRIHTLDKEWDEAINKLWNICEIDIFLEEEKLIPAAKTVLSKKEAENMALDMAVRKSILENA
jgi:hypothetical protein